MAFSKDRSNVYLWFDSEYTTLELDKACLLQVALWSYPYVKDGDF